jgi:hypothetical protein
VRRTLIQTILPLIFCAVPLLAAALIVLALPPQARNFYLERLTAFDYAILSLGGVLFVVQLGCAWQALQWRGTGFNERPDEWLNNLTQAAEWFPLLGLLGTVFGILQTFHRLEGLAQVPAGTVISAYAPAITATGSGLFMALANITPSWVVLLGRQLILALGGGEPADKEEPSGSALYANRR